MLYKRHWIRSQLSIAADFWLINTAPPRLVPPGSAEIAQLVIMDIPFQEYFHRNRQQCEENIQSIASALSGMHI